MTDKCTILVNSCDEYEELWEPFFICLKENWKNIKYPIVLNTESKSIQIEGLDIQTFQLYDKEKRICWGKRMKETLKRISSPYIIFLLDDFFLRSSVDIERLEKCIMWMEKNPNIAVFCFDSVKGKNIPSFQYTDFELRERKGEYRFNCQAAVWNRKKLIKFIRNHESPWDWEIIGSIRSRRYKEEFYSIIEGRKPIFDYYTGGAVHRGKWVLDCVEPLIEKYKLNIDLNKRGYQKAYNTKPSIEKKPPKRSIGKKIVNRLNLYLSIIKSLI